MRKRTWKCTLLSNGSGKKNPNLPSEEEKETAVNRGRRQDVFRRRQYGGRVGGEKKSIALLKKRGIGNLVNEENLQMGKLNSLPGGCRKNGAVKKCIKKAVRLRGRVRRNRKIAFRGNSQKGGVENLLLAAREFGGAKKEAGPP